MRILHMILKALSMLRLKISKKSEYKPQKSDILKRKNKKNSLDLSEDCFKSISITSCGHYNKITKKWLPTPHIHDPQAPGGVRPPPSLGNTKAIIMEFIIQKQQNTRSSSLIYHLEDNEFSSEPADKFGYTPILVNELQLIVGEKHDIRYVTGYCALFNHEETNNFPENYETENLVAVIDPISMPGISIKLNKNYRWPVSINKKMGWICIGDSETANKNLVEFSGGCIAALRNKELVALWLHPSNWEKVKNDLFKKLKKGESENNIVFDEHKIKISRQSTENSLLWLMSWNSYNDDCSSKLNKIGITTLDNPGWMLIVDLENSKLENKEFDEINIERSESDWIVSRIRRSYFEGFSGPLNLPETLQIFYDWSSQFYDHLDRHNVDSNHILLWLLDWYASQCDGYWEHCYGITICNTDKPGWSVMIDVTETECDGCTMKLIDIERSEKDWVYVSVHDNKFEGQGGVFNLLEILAAFREWVQYCQL